jgi:hypothetical protein
MHCHKIRNQILKREIRNTKLLGKYSYVSLFMLVPVSACLPACLYSFTNVRVRRFHILKISIQSVNLTIFGVVNRL